MSWGGPQRQQNYGGYGRPPAAQHGQPPAGQYGQPPAGQYGQPPAVQYGQPPAGQYGQPPVGQYGQPPAGQYGQPPAGQYGQPPAGQYGQPPAGHFRGPAPGYGAPQQGQSYGAPPGQQGGYGNPAPGHGQNPAYGGAQYGAPQGYGSAPPHGGGGYGGAGGGYVAPPPPGVSQDIWTWFQAVDTDKSNKITSNELQQALMNGNWSPFNAETCRLMIGMFDKDRNGTIDVHEFAALWKYIQDWKSCFDRFDTDRSGNIDANELGNAFRQFGYTLSPQFSQTVIRVFDRRSGKHCINFDDFIQACVMLKTLTDKFRMKDTNQNGVININYEEFLEMVLDTTINK